MVRKNCQKCGEFFWVYPSQIDYKYCSRECVSLSQRKGIKTECENDKCKNMVYAKPSKREKGWGKYCSKKCANEGMETKVKKECIICGDMFHVHLSEFKKGENSGKYCSKKCAGKGTNPKLYPKTYHLRQTILKRRYMRKHISNLNDRYIKKIIHESYKLKFKSIPKELIELKRLNITRKRTIKKLNQKQK